MKIQFTDVQYVKRCAERAVTFHNNNGWWSNSKAATCKDIINAADIALCKGGVVTLEQYELTAIPLHIWQEEAKRK